MAENGSTGITPDPDDPAHVRTIAEALAREQGSRFAELADAQQEAYRSFAVERLTTAAWVAQFLYPTNE